MTLSPLMAQDPAALTALEQDLLRPISHELPAGPSVRLEASFEELDRLIKSVDSLTATTSPDWQLISRNAFAILCQESKDLLVAAYWCLSLARWQGAAGMATGLRGLVMLSGQFWDVLHPEKRRSRARAAALEWLVERLVLWLEPQSFSSADREYLQAALQALSKLQTFCSEHLAGQEPEFAPLTRILRQQESRLAQVETKQPERSAPVAQEVSPVLERSQVLSSSETSNSQTAVPPVSASSQVSPLASIPAAGQALVDERGLRDYLRQLQLSSRSLVEALLRQDIRDPRPYEINRTMTWASISQLPQAKDGVTALKPVPLERRQLFQNLQEQGRQESLVQELEKSLSNAPFWLDGHYLVWQTLGALEAEEARRAVERCVAGFIGRYPQLVQFVFADGVPFASADTRRWIESLTGEKVAEALEISSLGIGRQERTESSDCVGHSEEILATAHQLARNKALPEALRLLQRHCHEGAGEAQRFQRQLQFAEFCIQHKLPDMARVLLEDLESRLNSLSVLQWEPVLSARVMHLLLKLGEKAKAGASSQERQASYFNRLCLLDAAKAIEFRS